MSFKDSEGLESGGPFSLSRPLSWDLPRQACRQLKRSPRPIGHGPGPPPHLCSTRWEQRDVWVGLAAMSMELHGAQASINHGAGQTPGPEPRQPSGLPALASSASRQHTPHQPLLLSRAQVLGLLPSVLLSLPAFPAPGPLFPNLPPSPHVPCPSSCGPEQKTLGKPRHMDPGQGLLLGPFPPQSG